LGVSENSKVSYLAADLLLQELQDLETLDRAQWALDHRILKGRVPLRFDQGYEFLEDIYDDLWPRIVIRKATQVGCSEWAVTHCLHISDITSYRGIYYFPTDTDVREFCQERINPAIASIPHLQDKALKSVTGIDNVHQKQIGKAWLYIRGLKNALKAKSVAADYLVFDELDEISPSLVEMARERIGASRLGYEYELSNPSLPKFGITKSFNESDQRYRLIKCLACNEWTCLEDSWIKDLACVSQDVRTKEWFLCCHKCRKRIHLLNAQWVPKRPSVTAIHGYQLSQLLSPQPRHSLQKIMEAWLSGKHRRQFWNLKLGLDFAGDAIPLNFTHMVACKVDSYVEHKGHHCTMGVDVHDRYLAVVVSVSSQGEGKVKRILNAWRIERHSETEDIFKRLDPYMAAYDVDICVVDAQPFKNSARGFCGRFPGRAWMCFYSDRQKDKVVLDKELPIVTVNRTEMLDDANDSWLSREVECPVQLLLDAEDTFPTEMTNMAKKALITEDTNDKVIRYIALGPDHFRHADNYDFIARHIRETRGANSDPDATYEVKQQEIKSGLPDGYDVEGRLRKKHGKDPRPFSGLPDGFI